MLIRIRLRIRFIHDPDLNISEAFLIAAPESPLDPVAPSASSAIQIYSDSFCNQTFKQNSSLAVQSKEKHDCMVHHNGFAEKKRKNSSLAVQFRKTWKIAWCNTMVVFLKRKEFFLQHSIISFQFDKRQNSWACLTPPWKLIASKFAHLFRKRLQQRKTAMSTM